MALFTGRATSALTSSLIYQATDWVQIILVSEGQGARISGNSQSGLASSMELPELVPVGPIILAPGDAIFTTSTYNFSVGYIIQSVPWSMKMLQSLTTGLK